MIPTRSRATRDTSGARTVSRRELLERLGGFDAETFTVPGGEDADLAWRAIAADAPAVFAEDARIFHAVSELGPVGKLRVAWRWTETMRIFAVGPFPSPATPWQCRQFFI